MRIGVISDTHMPHRSKQLPAKLTEGLRGVDLILHLGDWTDLSVLDMLTKLAPVNGIAGNNDGYEIQTRFGRRKLLELDGFRIGMIHGDGGSTTTERRAFDSFRETRPDIVLFGHSHKPYLQTVDGIVLFNPGSPTDKRAQPKFSYGILELDGTIKASHHYFADKS